MTHPLEDLGDLRGTVTEVAGGGQLVLHRLPGGIQPAKVAGP
ncbi:MAG TPA: hypothetical protein VK361_03195 [Rubrobacteraceae bacterium]|nr:hypothetical protein [Rubrobacteraceae bacterium]